MSNLLMHSNNIVKYSTCLIIHSMQHTLNFFYKKLFYKKVSLIFTKNLRNPIKKILRLIWKYLIRKLGKVT